MAGKYQTLPYVFGIPHGSTSVPADLEARLASGLDALRAQSDIATETVYDLPARSRVVARAHRFVCDVNRDPAAQGQAGPVPIRDLDGQALWKEGREPDEELVRTLVERFHAPYHAALREGRQDEDVLYHFECHSMEAIPPPGAPDRPRFEEDEAYRRPEICLGNNGDAEGRPREGAFTTCPTEEFVELGQLLTRQGFEVRLNDPYSTDHAANLHGRRWYAGLERVPVIQLELRQDLWLSGPRGVFDPDRGMQFRARLRMVLEEFADYLTQAEVEIG